MRERIFVVATTAAETCELIAQLTSAGMQGVSATSAELLRSISASEAAVAILTVESLAGFETGALRETLRTQAPWSDCPMLLIAPRGYVPDCNRRALDGVGKIAILERPLPASELLIAVARALRSRARQHRAKTYLQERLVADEKVRSLAATLETRVIARTIELSNAVAQHALAEERAHENEESYRLTIELGSQTPWTANTDLEVLTFGKNSMEPNALIDRDFRGRKWLDFIQPDMRDAIDALWQEAANERKPLDCELLMRMPDSEYRWHRARGNPRLDSDGRIMRWYGTIENIHEQKQADARFQQMQVDLIHASRITAMGTMASALAHELNQPLSAVANYVRGITRLLSVANPDIAAILAALGEADRSAVRAGEIVRRLREMVTRGTVERGPQDLLAMVEETCELALIDAPSLGIVVRFDLQPAIVDVDRIQIQQVLINLLRNAVEALQGTSARVITISSKIDCSTCYLRVTDNGPGLTPAVAARLFDPFNTTKTGGMGIGLSISRTIIESHGGTISGGPSPDGGTMFTISLPLSTSRSVVR